jgi:hypothetical protein
MCFINIIYHLRSARSSFAIFFVLLVCKRGTSYSPQNIDQDTLNCYLVVVCYYVSTGAMALLPSVEPPVQILSY